MNEKEIKELNIYEKMSLITEEMGVVEKNLKVQVSQTNSYQAVSERDILDNVKPLEKKYFDHYNNESIHRQTISAVQNLDQIVKRNQLHAFLHKLYPDSVL